MGEYDSGDLEILCAHAEASLSKTLIFGCGSFIEFQYLYRPVNVQVSVQLPVSVDLLLKGACSGNVR
jgi:hypothetical protein